MIIWSNSTFIFLHCFYYYSLFKLQLNRCKLFLFPRLFINQVLFFDVSKISFILFVQDLFCCFLTRVYHIYCISVHWYWNLSSGVIENCEWDVSKPDIQIFFPAGLWKVVVRVAVSVVLSVSINILIGFKEVPQVWHFWWVVGNLFINITEDCQLCWFYIFINITEKI